MTRTTDKPVAVDFLLRESTATGAGIAISNSPAKKTFNAELVGAGATATIDIEASNIGTAGSYKAIATITLTSAAPSDAFYFDGPYGQVRANLKAISGAGATVTVAMGS